MTTGNNEVAIVVLLSISFLMFLGIVLYHILLRVKSGVDIKVIIKKNAEIFMSKICVKRKKSYKQMMMTSWPTSMLTVKRI